MTRPAALHARFLLLLWLLLAAPAFAQGYFPPRGDWARATPAQSGFDPKRLQEAVDYAAAHEAKEPRDQSGQRHLASPQPPAEQQQG